MFQKASRNKSFKFPRVSNYDKSDGDHHFIPSARDLLRRDQLWGHFGVIFDENMKRRSRKYQDQSRWVPNGSKMIFEQLGIILFKIFKKIKIQSEIINIDEDRLK